VTKLTRVEGKEPNLTLTQTGNLKSNCAVYVPACPVAARPFMKATKSNKDLDVESNLHYLATENLSRCVSFALRH